MLACRDLAQRGCKGYERTSRGLLLAEALHALGGHDGRLCVSCAEVGACVLVEDRSLEVGKCGGRKMLSEPIVVSARYGCVM